MKIAVLMITLVPGVVWAGADPLETASTRQATERAPGATQVGSFFKATAQKTDWTVPLQTGRCYWFSGVSGDKVEKLALYLWPPNANLFTLRLTSERSPTGSAVMSHCPKIDGVYKFQAKIEGKGSYLVGVFARDLPRPPAAVTSTAQTAPGSATATGSSAGAAGGSATVTGSSAAVAAGGVGTAGGSTTVTGSAAAGGSATVTSSGTAVAVTGAGATVQTNAVAVSNQGGNLAVQRGSTSVAAGANGAAVKTGKFSMNLSGIGLAVPGLPALPPGVADHQMAQLPPPPPPLARNCGAGPGLPCAFSAKHRSWTDTLLLKPDGSFSRGSGVGGTWSVEGGAMVLTWARWPYPKDVLPPDGRGGYASNQLSLVVSAR